MNKKLLATLWIIAIILIMAGSGCGLLFSLNDNTADGLIAVTITRVVDGDTAYALLPDGKEEKIRFIGVDAPEINHPRVGLEPYGREADAFTREKLTDRKLWLEFDQGQHDQYDRMLAYLWLEIPDDYSDQEIREKMFNAHLLLEGYATQVVFQPNVKYVDFFNRYQEEAKASGKGLWSLEDEFK